MDAGAAASTTAGVDERQSSPHIPAKQNGPTAMTSEAYFDALGTRDLELILPHFALDATWTIPGDPALTPWAGCCTGPEQIRQSLTAFFGAVEPLAFVLQTMVEADGRVLAQGRYVSRFHPSGQVLESEMILRFTVADGLITDYRVFEDSLGITRTYFGEPLTTTPP
ncbi:nuclear transport factor 2 family protein [Streptomyces sp. NBC_01728]|uniref:nuclear transport factor 2 family protein n=1 Tax=unclassified Streptomyces TaxID=2593676 RepID=UPI00225A6964|nr:MULTISPECIES: nuclear transport factor 2 family protein [unclassified Streptomyces]MCX4461686.1 nuclear transport factor 2 family protein [Streptomyces sp. NBC_01719]MCX4490595.1 nuclear transport factor 2 family protein [Streptomyces sp. NBC_01728]